MIIKAANEDRLDDVKTLFNTHFGDTLNATKFYSRFVKNPNFIDLLDKIVTVHIYRISLADEVKNANESDKTEAFVKWLEAHKPIMKKDVDRDRIDAEGAFNG